MEQAIQGPTTDYRVLLAEVLEKRRRAGSVSSVLPGVGGERVGIVTPRP